MAFTFQDALAKVREANRLTSTGRGDPGAVSGYIKGFQDQIGGYRSAPTFADYLAAQEQAFRDQYAVQNPVVQGSAPLPASVLSMQGNAIPGLLNVNPNYFQQEAAAYAAQKDASATKPFNEILSGIGLDPAQLEAEYEYYRNAPASEIDQLMAEVQKGAADYKADKTMANLAIGIGASGVAGGLLGAAGGPVLGTPITGGVTSPLAGGTFAGVGGAAAGAGAAGSALTAPWVASAQSGVPFSAANWLPAGALNGGSALTAPWVASAQSGVPFNPADWAPSGLLSTPTVPGMEEVTVTGNRPGAGFPGNGGYTTAGTITSPAGPGQAPIQSGPTNDPIRGAGYFAENPPTTLEALKDLASGVSSGVNPSSVLRTGTNLLTNALAEDAPATGAASGMSGLLGARPNQWAPQAYPGNPYPSTPLRIPAYMLGLLGRA